MAPLIPTTLLLSVVSVGAVSFLGSHEQKDSPVSTAALRDLALKELRFLDQSAVNTFREGLAPVFAVLPKNQHGKLDSTSVRFALHRYFASRNGWQVNGLAHAGQGWNTSLATTVMKDQVPSYIQDVFEQSVNGTGMGLQELAGLAATIADLIRRESRAELDYIYTALGHNTSSVHGSVLTEVFTKFLVAKIWGIEDHDPRRALNTLKNAEIKLEEEYLEWDDTKLWAFDLLETFEYNRKSRWNPFLKHLNYEQVVDMTEEINVRHSTLHFRQCRALKSQLMDLEHSGTGRVPLPKFYSGSSRDEWPFVERADYLRSMGALDETDPRKPSVIIANYLLGPTSCVGVSAYYSLCCQDECEALLAHVEQAVGEPTGSAARIAEVVSQLPSDTVHAPRNLSTAQIMRLDEIAKHHNGQVPLHGRLFAQWLHHVYPRECVFPHVSGVTTQLLPDEWALKNGLEHANEEDATMQQTMVQMWKDDGDFNSDTLPWNEVEELVSTNSFSTRRSGWSAWSCMRKAAVLALVCSIFVSISRSAKGGEMVSALVGSSKADHQSHFV